MTKPETIDAATFRKRAKLPPATGAPKRKRVSELVAMGKAKVAMPLRKNTVTSFTLKVVGDLCDLNQMLRNRGHRIRGVEASKDLLKLEWRSSGCPAVSGPYRVQMHTQVGSRKKDPSNLYTGALKAFLDALQDLGAVEGDGWKHHVGPDSFSWEFVKGITCITTITIHGESDF
jgi:hypothetical protein